MLMKKQMRKELRIGLLLFAAAMVLKNFDILPEFLHGALLGLAICFELIGALSEEKYRRLKAWKRSIFN